MQLCFLFSLQFASLLSSFTLSLFFLLCPTWTCVTSWLNLPIRIPGNQEAKIESTGQKDQWRENPWGSFPFPHLIAVRITSVNATSLKVIKVNPSSFFTSLSPILPLFHPLPFASLYFYLCTVRRSLKLIIIMLEHRFRLGSPLGLFSSSLVQRYRPPPSLLLILPPLLSLQDNIANYILKNLRPRAKVTTDWEYRPLHHLLHLGQGQVAAHQSPAFPDPRVRAMSCLQSKLQLQLQLQLEMQFTPHSYFVGDVFASLLCELQFLPLKWQLRRQLKRQTLVLVLRLGT